MAVSFNELAVHYEIPVVFGPVTDLVCLDDVDLFARETADPLQQLVQDVYHMLIEKPGTNLDLPTRGIDVYSALSGPVSALKILANRIDQQLPLDPRVDTSSTTIVQDAYGTYELRIILQVDAGLLNLLFTYSPGEALFVLSTWGLS
jgi:hypothetical protein